MARPADRTLPSPALPPSPRVGPDPDRSIPRSGSNFVGVLALAQEAGQRTHLRLWSKTQGTITRGPRFENCRDRGFARILLIPRIATLSSANPVAGPLAV